MQALSQLSYTPEKLALRDRRTVQANLLFFNFKIPAAN